jgi:ribosomal-protein-alanine N-acetyltransferase
MSAMMIENDRIMMHPLEETDFDAFQRMRQSKRIYRYEPSYLPELQGAPETAFRRIQALDLERDRQWVLGIYEKAAPELLTGLGEFYDYKPCGSVISIGYRLLEAYWGRGIAGNCVSAMLQYLRDHTAIQMVTAHVIPENQASSRLLLRNGFEHRLTKLENWGNPGDPQPRIAELYTFDLVR